MDQKETYWSKFAQTYDTEVEFVVGKEVRAEMAARLASERHLGMTVEFGCRTGYFTKAYQANADRVIATDLSDEMLEVARNQLKPFGNVAVQKANCEETPFPDVQFDTVVMVNVIHIVGDPSKALRESHRILKDRGVLLILNNTDYGLSMFDKARFYFRFVSKFGMPPVGGRNYSPEALRSLVENSGFTVERLDMMKGDVKWLFLKARKR